MDGTWNGADIKGAYNNVLSRQSILEGVKGLIVHFGNMNSGVEGLVTPLSSENSDIKSSNEELLEDCWAKIPSGLDYC